MSKSVTMSDIAKELGVSTVTVSKALADKDGVSEEVRETIKKKARQMGYRYNSLAKSVRAGVSGNIGVLVSERYFSDNAFYANLYKRNVVELSKQNYSCILEIISKEDEFRGILPAMLENNKVDGIIVLGQMKRPYVQRISETKIPYVLQDFYDEKVGEDAVVSDNVYGGYLLTKYLLEKGHDSIAFVGNIYATSSIMDRYLGYYRALLETRREIRPNWVIIDRDEQNGTYEKLPLPKNLPSAFFCNCDEVAFTLVNQLKGMGLKVPEDVSVVGFDDYIFATVSDPQLTTYRVALETMSETTVDAIVKKIKDSTYKIGRKVVGGTLIYRDSVKQK